jgi:hypothetical protein
LEIYSTSQQSTAKSLLKCAKGYPEAVKTACIQDPDGACTDTIEWASLEGIFCADDGLYWQ